MQPLSLEESKQIVTEFLRHIGMYNKEKIEKYFTPAPLRPLKPKKSIIQRIIDSFIVFQPLPTKIVLYNFYPTDEHIFSPHYEISISAPIIAFEDDNLRLEFSKVLLKTLKENDINYFYATAEDWGEP